MRRRGKKMSIREELNLKTGRRMGYKGKLRRYSEECK